jgi:hypothetical protein
MKVGSAHPWGLDIFSIQDKRVSIAVGIIIVVGVGIGIGIDPDTDSDPDTDGNQKQTDRQQPGSGGRCPPYGVSDVARMVGGAHPILSNYLLASPLFF